jgi:hypothetical protein
MSCNTNNCNQSICNCLSPAFPRCLNGVCYCEELFTTPFGPGSWFLPCPDTRSTNTVTSFQATASSLQITFFDSVGNIIETFTDIPGKLDTERCANGSYDDEAVKGLFLRLINYRFDTSVIGSIPFKLAAFFASIALEQRIVDSIIVLTEKLLTGEITLEQFNVLVKVAENDAASLYGKDYETNFVGLVQAIQKTNNLPFVVDTPCKCNDPVKKCNCNDH